MEIAQVISSAVASIKIFKMLSLQIINLPWFYHNQGCIGRTI